jgi:hypothetical protein
MSMIKSVTDFVLIFFSQDEAASLNTPCPAAKPTADSAATTVPWHQVVVRPETILLLESAHTQGVISHAQKQLDMSKKQREAIAAGYDCYIQSEAFLRDECLDLAAKLQVHLSSHTQKND